MSTTIMKDSVVGDAWIKQAADLIPVQWVKDANGNPTGNFLTGPIRACFTNIMELPKPTATAPNPKYGVMGLFTPYVDWTIFESERARIMAETFGAYRGVDGQYYGLHSPYHDQAEKAIKYGGFTPGLTYLNFTSKFKPPVVDINGQPVVDPARIYPGVWLMLSVNAYAYGVNPPQPKKGVGFGIQSVMILGDDTPLAGGAADPKAQFANVKGLSASPISRPNLGAMGGAPAGGAGPLTGAPGGAPAGFQTAPTTYAPPSGAPAPTAAMQSPGGKTAEQLQEEADMREMGLL